MLLLIFRFSGIDLLPAVVPPLDPGPGSNVPASAVKTLVVTSQTLLVGQGSFDTLVDGSVSGAERQRQYDAGEVVPFEGSVNDGPADPEPPREKSGPSESFQQVRNKRHISVVAGAGGRIRV